MCMVPAGPFDGILVLFDGAEYLGGVVQNGLLTAKKRPTSSTDARSLALLGSKHAGAKLQCD